MAGQPDYESPEWRAQRATDAGAGRRMNDTVNCTWCAKPAGWWIKVSRGDLGRCRTSAEAQERVSAPACDDHSMGFMRRAMTADHHRQLLDRQQNRLS